jgi:NAD(P)-dependent dehydrogenase (short-subunit alcohol dehydrogenase family)
MTGQTVVITGATSGLGLESARRLSTAGANVIVTARTDEKGRAAVQTVQSHLQSMGLEYPNQCIRYKLLDLDDLSSVRRFAVDWENSSDNNDTLVPQKIDVLLNNAGIMALPTRQLTVDGYERQMQSNHLGHFLLTGLLVPYLSDTARIVTVSSSAHQIPGSRRGMQWDYCWNAESSGYGAWKSYGQSKLANVLFTQELQRRARAAGRNWTCTTLHPGVVRTDLARYMMPETTSAQSGRRTTAPSWWSRLALTGMSWFLKTPEQGATTQVWLASGAPGTTVAKDDIGGRYFVDCQPQELQWAATDEYAARRLWKESQERADIVYDFENSGAVVVAAPIGEHDVSRDVAVVDAN